MNLILSVLNFFPFPVQPAPEYPDLGSIARIDDAGAECLHVMPWRSPQARQRSLLQDRCRFLPGRQRIRTFRQGFQQSAHDRLIP